MPRKNNGPYLAQNRAGVWEIRWTEDGGRSRRKSTGCGERVYAEQAFAEWLRGYRGGVRSRRTGAVRVGDALNLYLKEHVEPRTIDAKRIMGIVRWLQEGFSLIPICDFSDHTVQDYTTKRRTGQIGTGGAADSTIRRELGALVAALRYAARRGLITEVPHVPMPAAAPPKDDWMTEAQVDALLQVLAEEDRDSRMSRVHRFVVLGLATGARKASIETLDWRHVQGHTGLIRFDQQAARVTKKRRVAVPIADWLVPHLDRMRHERTGDAVLDRHGSIRSAFEYAMKRAARVSGDQGYLAVTPHTLRHTCATLMLRAGATLWQVAGMLGDTPETVSKIYGHHAQDHLREAANSWKKGA